MSFLSIRCTTAKTFPAETVWLLQDGSPDWLFYNLVVEWNEAGTVFTYSAILDPLSLRAYGH